MNAFSSIRVSRRAGLAAVWITVMLLTSLPLQVVEAQPLSLAPASAAGSRCTGDGIYLYENINYGGRCLKLTADNNDLSKDNFNDTASSIRFVGSYGGGKYAVILYADAGKRGVHSAFGADDPDLRNDKIGNDSASSVKIGKVPQCVGDGIYLYENKNYGGRCRKFTSSYDDMSNTGFEDIASSVKLVGIYGGERRTVRLCAHPGYNGACTSFSADDPNLGNDEIGNDRTSSLHITYNMRWPVGEPNGAGFGVYGPTFLQYAGVGQGKSEFYPGIAIMRDPAPGRLANGQAVYAAYRGRVVSIVPGVSIILEHTIDNTKVYTQYTNVDKYRIKVGDWVAKGQRIGTIKNGFLLFAVSYQQPASVDVVGQDCKWVQSHYEDPFLWLGTSGGKTTAASCQ